MGIRFNKRTRMAMGIVPPWADLFNFTAEFLRVYKYESKIYPRMVLQFLVHYLYEETPMSHYLVFCKTKLIYVKILLRFE